MVQIIKESGTINMSYVSAFVGLLQRVPSTVRHGKIFNYHHFVSLLQHVRARLVVHLLVITIILSASYSDGEVGPVAQDLVITIILSASYSGEHVGDVVASLVITIILSASYSPSRIMG